jgi:hypothetical protein
MSNYYNSSMSNTNNHNTGLVTQMPSVFNRDNSLISNNSEFASLDKRNGDDFAPVVILGAIAIQSYLNAPTDEKDVKEGTTGSEYLLLPSSGGFIVDSTKELGKKYLGESLKTSVFGATTAATVNVLDQTATQVAEQMWNQKTFYMNNINWNDININEKEVIMSGITGFVLAPSMLDTVLDKSKGSFMYSNEAWKKLQKEAYDAKSQSKIDKLQPRIDAHIQNQWNHIKFQGATYGITEGANFIFIEEEK